MPLKNKLDSAVARLDRLRLHGDSDRYWEEQRAELFEWVFGLVCDLPSGLFSTSTLRQIKDAGIVLYNRMSTEDYKESQDDIQAASRIAEDIRDTLLKYQVCSHKPYATGCN